MSDNQQKPNTVLEAFGKACGVVVAFLTTMPIYHSTYNYFYHYALSYSTHDYLWFWELVLIATLFCFVVVSVWFALTLLLGLIKGLAFIFALTLSSLRR